VPQKQEMAVSFCVVDIKLLLDAQTFEVLNIMMSGTTTNQHVKASAHKTDLNALCVNVKFTF